MNNKIDHVVIGADNLVQGTNELKAKLGVIVPRGGKHKAMSTHNCVMQTGNESFLELIAIDPEAPINPGRTRWYTLDDPMTKSRLSERACALCWVVRTDDLDGVVATSPIELGEIVSLSRGDFSWRLTVPKDGSLRMGGLLPAFIQWSAGPHPSSAQQDLSVRLEKVRLTHPNPAKLAAILKSLQVDHLAEVTNGDISLSFELNTPKGTVTLN